MPKKKKEVDLPLCSSRLIMTSCESISMLWNNTSAQSSAYLRRGDVPCCFVHIALEFLLLSSTISDGTFMSIDANLFQVLCIQFASAILWWPINTTLTILVRLWVLMVPTHIQVHSYVVDWMFNLLEILRLCGNHALPMVNHLHSMPSKWPFV